LKRFFSLPKNLPNLGASLTSVGFRAAFALAVSKWIAVGFGPAGTALFGQLMNLYSSFSCIPIDGLSRAMVKDGARFAQAGKEEQAAEVVAGSYGLLVLIFGLQWVIALFIALFTNWFAPFQSDGFLPWFLLGFGLLSSVYFGSNVFLIWKKTKIQSFLAAGLSFGGLLGYGIAFFYGTAFQGCLLAYVLGQVTIALISILYFSKALPQIWQVPKWKMPVVRNLLRFTFGLSLTFLINQISNYAFVHWALDAMGTQKVGLWMAMNRLADVFCIPILAIANAILLPLLSSHADKPGELHQIISPTFKLSLFGLGIGLAALFWLYPYILPILYSAEFVADTSWIGWQVGGDFFKSSTYVFAVLVLAMGHIRFYFWLETGSTLLVFALSWAFYGKLGYIGLFIAHFIRFLLYWIILVWRYRKILI